MMRNVKDMYRKPNSFRFLFSFFPVQCWASNPRPHGGSASTVPLSYT